MVTDNYTYCGEHLMYIIVKLLSCTHEINILCVNYFSIRKEKGKEGKTEGEKEAKCSSFETKQSVRRSWMLSSWALIQYQRKHWLREDLAFETFPYEFQFHWQATNFWSSKIFCLRNRFLRGLNEIMCVKTLFAKLHNFHYYLAS